MSVRRSRHFELTSRRKGMKANLQFVSILVAACVSILLSLPATARPADAPQDQGAAQTQSGPPDKTQQDKQKAGTSPGKDVGKGGEDVGKGTAKGAGSLGKGAAGAGKDVGVGAGKGAGKSGEGSAKGIGKLGGKIFHRGSKNKEKSGG